MFVVVFNLRTYEIKVAEFSIFRNIHYREVNLIGSCRVGPLFFTRGKYLRNNDQWESIGRF